MSTQAHIYCLVRGKDNEAAKNRLVKVLEFYFGSNFSKDSGSRVTVLAGDVTLNRFGLDEKTYCQLADRVDSVFHMAALVKLFGDYKEHEAVNVEGTRRVAEFCAAFGKILRYASTISVSGGFMCKQTSSVPEFCETDLFVGQNVSDNVYIKSKFQAEKIISNMSESGLRASIFRVGDLTGRYSDGTFQMDAEKNFTFQILRALLNIGILPEKILREKFEFSPVDSASKAIILLSRENTNEINVYHILNHKKFEGSFLYLDVLKSLGHEFEVMEGATFKKYLEYIRNESDKAEEISYLENCFNYDKMFDEKYRVDIRSEYTVDCLKKLGFEWPEADRNYLKRSIKYLESIGFFPKFNKQPAMLKV